MKRLLLNTLLTVVAFVGAGCIVSASWDLSPSFGKAVLGLFLLYVGRQLVLTDE